MLADRLSFSLDPLIAEAKRRARYRRLAGGALLAVALAVVAAVFGLRSLPPHRANGSGPSGGITAHSGSGEVVGSIRWVGGSAFPSLSSGGLVTVYNARGKVIRRVSVWAGHDFQLHLSPGRYHFGYPENPEALQSCHSPSIAIRSGRITRQNLFLGCGYY
jgi:hypothetical protein